jgi:hypothetical protein
VGVVEAAGDELVVEALVAEQSGLLSYGAWSCE